MNDKKSKLQALWEELNQSEEDRLQAATKARLAQRARIYAAPIREAENYSEDEVYQVLSFRLGDERYAVDVDAVQGIRSLEQLTRVPSVPKFYRGVVNIRGQIISVLDLRAFFGIGQSEIIPKSELVLINAQNMSLALMADRIEEVQHVPRHEVEHIEMTYALGVSRQRLIILDMRLLLSDERLIVDGKND